MAGDLVGRPQDSEVDGAEAVVHGGGLFPDAEVTERTEALVSATGKADVPTAVGDTERIMAIGIGRGPGAVAAGCRVGIYPDVGDRAIVVVADVAADLRWGELGGEVDIGVLVGDGDHLLIGADVLAAQAVVVVPATTDAHPPR